MEHFTIYEIINLILKNKYCNSVKSLSYNIKFTLLGSLSLIAMESDPLQRLES